MNDATGGRCAAPIWARFMRFAVPVQQKANRLRRAGPYAINLPLPDVSDEEVVVERSPADMEIERRRKIAAWFDESGDETLGAAGQTVYLSEGGGITVFRPSQSRLEEKRYYPDLGMEGGTSDQRLLITDRTGQVAICAESARLATAWCPSTFKEDPTVARLPESYCRFHRAPPGEE